MPRPPLQGALSWLRGAWPASAIGGRVSPVVCVPCECMSVWVHVLCCVHVVMCSVWLCVACGYMYNVVVCPLWVCVPCGCMSPVGVCPVWVCVLCGCWVHIAPLPRAHVPYRASLQVTADGENGRGGNAGVRRNCSDCGWTRRNEVGPMLPSAM